MPNEILQKPGTQINWGSAGGETEAMTLANLANGAVREGEEHDFGATHAMRWRLFYKVDFAVAPTAGEVVEIYFAWSHDGTSYDGDHGGADAAGAVADLPNMKLVHVHVCKNNTDNQWSGGIMFVETRWGAPAVYNNSGQALTNAAADQELILEPLIDEIQ